jgi:hypothetical protein
MKIHSLNTIRIRGILAAGCLLFGWQALKGQSPIALEAILTGRDDEGADVRLGSPVSVSGDTLAIPGGGGVIAFLRQGHSWSQQAILSPFSGEPDDSFGWSLAISGDTIVVTAPFEDSNATGVNGNRQDNSATDSGAAYVFERTGTAWSEVAYLKASIPRPNLNFGGTYSGGTGNSVAISGDTIVVGAALDSTRGSGAGAAYVFVRGQTGWTQQAILYASNAGSGDRFGGTVAVSGDTIVAGAQYESSAATGVNGNQFSNSAQFAGAAYVFVRNGTTWTQQAYLKASNTEIYDYFGSAVAISGDTIAIGAIGDDSASSGVNGSQGNFNNDGVFNSGAVYVFGRSGTSWAQRAYLKSDSPGRGDQFGSDVATTGDAVICGTYPVGGQWNAHVFARQGNGWTHLARLDRANSGSPDLLTWSVAASGNTVAVTNSVFTGLPPPAPPPLTINSASPGIRLSWPLSAAAWLLESSESLHPASAWTAIPPPYEIDATGYFFLAPATSGRQFFRLRKP